MTDKDRFPQIPGTVWWGVRSLLNRTPKVTFDERLLSVELNVQETAAKAYITELKGVGLLTDEGRATPLAHEWRADDTYADATSKIIESAYPEQLRHLAPPDSADRQKVISWFQKSGLGEGSAKNRAATYLLIGSASPNDAAPRPSNKPKDISSAGTSTRKSTAGKEIQRTPIRAKKLNDEHPRTPTDMMPLNVNIQIHISAEAGTEQIESIFSAMRRYLYDAQSS